MKERLLRLHGMRRQRVAHDLAEHFHQRVRVQIEDILDTARIAGLPAGVINEMVIGRLLAFVAFFWKSEGRSKQEFLAMCDELFDDRRQRIELRKRARQR